MTFRSGKGGNCEIFRLACEIFRRGNRDFSRFFVLLFYFPPFPSPLFPFSFIIKNEKWPNRAGAWLKAWFWRARAGLLAVIFRSFWPKFRLISLFGEFRARSATCSDFFRFFEWKIARKIFSEKIPTNSVILVILNRSFSSNLSLRQQIWRKWAI